MKRRIRKLVDAGLPIAGMLMVFASVLLVTELRTQIAFVLVGVILIEAGIWKLANPLLPSERKYSALRNEVDDFIRRIRTLNRTAIAANAGDTAAQLEREQILTELHAAVERMNSYAGNETGTTPALR